MAVAIEAEPDATGGVFEREFRNSETSPLGWRSILEKVKGSPGADAHTLASSILRPLTKEELRAFARAYVVDEIQSWRRIEALRVERAAERLRQEAERQKNARAEEERREAARIEGQEQYRRNQETRAQRVREMEGWRDNPTSVSMLRAPEERRFRQWMGASYASWYDEWHEKIAQMGSEFKLVRFESMFGDVAHDFYVGFSALMRDQAAQIRLEVTEELLNTMFALGDGVRVTWGEATIAQHRQRIQMLTKNAVANMESATRHEVAIRMIEEAGANCLADVAAAAVA